MTSNADSTRLSPSWRSSRWFILTVVCVSYMTTLFLYGMIVPIMPSALVARAGVLPRDKVYWTSIMLVAETAAAFFTCPVFGYWVDRAGRRKGPFLAGLVLLAASMCIFTVARSVATYIIARLLQGASAAMVEVAGLALLKDVVGRQGLGEALGYMGTASMVGLMAGPPMGGLLNKVGGYYAVCALGFAIVALDAALRFAVLEKGEVGRGNNSAQYSAIPSTDTEDQDAAPGGNTTHPPSDSNAQRGVAFATLELLKQPRVAITLWAFVVDGIIIGAFDATVPSFVEKLFGWDSFAAGLIFLVMAAPSLLEPLFGRLCDRFGVRIMAVIGYSLLTPSLVCLRFVSHDSVSQKILFGVLVAFCGISPDLGQPGLYVESQMVIEEMEEQSPGIFGEKGAVAQAFGLQTMANYAGLAIGPILGEALFDNYGWKAMALALGALSAATVVPSFWLSNRTYSQETEGTEEEHLRVAAAASYGTL
ncbi:hypothetical protein CNMCM8980_002237 [Aspergillus fumigatiaffinis]|uniref:Major facilitator superfamily (MFS) profile domain-containing protein n=1 Tax=Aspergillus fumigatiaffinis TaxID=340414 RepID=A0A8H4GSJ1_9EURO|nr:hypothetical protein CNMCM5878_002683 [Aspergillus fumigatiaffinis]KAF4220140.1 hypothetical protein CNMCM6457_002552 [Aspergillus fumigatiaffinis]KAF4227654.1 hypothetical protein CNMCM6805_002749 [Aspergillus fumigatiaffinis]KAF4238005.1 hypothetical protein CNMCM8980_002237 [Aspergillus fumigatiaffinis]